jgi:hypothetical protein
VSRSRRPRIRLYLDVDGVLNAGHPRWGDAVTVTVVATRDGQRIGQRVTYSPSLILELTLLAEEFDIEIVWLTTWLVDHSVRDLTIAMNGLTGGRSLIAPRRDGRHGELPADWKRAAILEDLAREPGPFIWADDDEVPVHGSFVAAAFQVPSLLLAPVFEFGLQRSDVNAIRRFTEGLTPSAR